jgi:hypothetical protein
MLLLIDNTRMRIFLLALLLIVVQEVGAQNKKPKFTDIKISGYFRNYITYRSMQQNYATGGPLTPRTLMVNGIYRDAAGNGQLTGYREPMMMVVLEGKPSVNTSFVVDFLLDNQMTGQIFNDKLDLPSQPHGIGKDPNSGVYQMPRRIQAARWLNLGGSIFTKYGLFDFKAGGVINMNMTPSTLKFYSYRDDMFERFPWEWQTNSFKRYLAYYEDKNVARDPRLGSASVQGITITGSQMPFRTGFVLIYGKANNTNAWQSFLTNNNQSIFAVQLHKKISTHSVTANYYQSTLVIRPQRFDKSFHNIAQEQAITSELNVNVKGFNFYSETGAGSVSNPIDSIKKWSPVVITNLGISKGIIPLPINLQYYYIGGGFVNPNSAILNTSNRNVQAQFGNQLQYNNNIFEGAITEFGQMANNRQGFNLSSTLDVKKHLRFSVALSSQQELQNIFNMITVQHRLNGFTRSQFVYYRNQVGPYGRQMNTWRRSWEKITVTDSSSYKKGFNLIDFSARLKTKLFNRDLIFSNYVNYNSVQDKFAPVAIFSSKAFVRNLYEEFMTFYNIHNKLTLVGLVGLERTVGNARTELAPNGKPIDQTGHGYGAGLDIDLSPVSGLYIRQRWYSFSDKNFILDRFRGFDTTVELKIFF